MEFKNCLDEERFKEYLDSDVLLGFGYHDATSHFLEELEIILSNSQSSSQFKKNLNALYANRKAFLNSAEKLLP